MTASWSLDSNVVDNEMLVSDFSKRLAVSVDPDRIITCLPIKISFNDKSGSIFYPIGILVGSVVGSGRDIPVESMSC